MLDDGQHDDDKDQLRSQEHLDEEPLGDRCSSAESGCDVEITGEQARHDTRRAKSPGDLRQKHQPASQRR